MIDLDGFDCATNEAGFAELFPKSGTAPAKDFWIAWNTDSGGKITGTLITNDDKYWDAKNDPYRATGGRCYADWMLPVDERDSANLMGMPDQLFSPPPPEPTRPCYVVASRLWGFTSMF